MFPTHTWTKFTLRLLAVFIPFYFVFYPALYEQPDNPEAQTLWKYIFTGFLAYLILAMVVFFLSPSETYPRF